MKFLKMVEKFHFNEKGVNMKRYILLISVIAALTSCVQGPEIQPTTPTRAVSIDAVATKTMYDGTNIVWESGDEVSVFFHHSTSGYNVTRFSSNVEQGQTATKAKFSGAISSDVALANGYGDFGYAVYPTTVAVEGGKIMYDLPSSQVAGAKGSFQSGLNLASSVILLSDIEDDGSASAYFRNALSYIRINLTEDVKSVTVTGTAPLAGKAPLVVGSDDKVNDSYGRLMVDSSAEWSASSKSVTLTPSVGQTFEAGTYNLLIWPGTHTGLTVTLNFNEYGEYNKPSKISTEKPFTFVAGKYYSMNVKNTEELVIEEILNGVDVPEVDSDLAAEIEALLSQVQSVSLMTEYLDNAAYARYSKFGSTNVKQDIELSYMVRPVEIAEQLVEKYSEALSAVVTYPGPAEYTTLPVNAASLTDDGILTVSIDADGISNDFYSGAESAKLALQISSGRSDLLSDFANLHPKIGAALDFTRSKDIPVLKGATVSIPFKYAPNGDSYTLSSPDERSGRVQIVNHQGLYSGVVNVNISDSDLASQSVTVVLTSGDEVIEEVLTFAEGPQFEIQDIPMMDCIGGYFSINVNADWTAYNEPSYSLHVGGGTHSKEYNSYTWIKEAAEGVSGTYSVEENVTIVQDKLDKNGKIVYKKDENGNPTTTPETVQLHDGSQRSATAVFEVKIKDTGLNGDLSYRMTRPIIQKAEGTRYNPNLYYKDGDKLTLQTASSGHAPLNIVILGDGYKKKDLIKEVGLFESRARSAMDSFFGIEPYKYYRNRFNVYMVAYESVDEGTDSRDKDNNTVVAKDTYFDTYHKPQTELWLGQGGEKVKNIVTDVVKADIYRTIAIVLVNTNENAGTSSQLYLVQDGTSYYGEPYKGFGVACVAANSEGMGGLIKHEAGGHAFGRLADEYLDGNDSIVKEYDGNLTDAHNKGQYRNVTTYKGYWDDLMNYPGYSSVIGYVDGGLSCDKGIYRPTTGGMMFNNQGVFNAVCRRIIYERIIRQTEGAGAYSLDKFVEYDNINMPK